MQMISTLVAALVCFVFLPSARAAGKARHVVVIVWDGMRPDFVAEKNCPNLYQLANGGVRFTHHHAVYLSATEVNGTALSTGAFPAHDGIIGNSEYRPQLDPLKAIHTENPSAVRKGDELSGGKYLRLPTMAEIVRQAGRKAVVAGAKPVALLADRSQRTSSSADANVFAGSTLPPNLLEVITTRYGQFPAEHTNHPSRNDWTTGALIDPLWAEGVPDFSFLWMNEPDSSQHQTGPGSEQSLAAIRNADENLGRVLKILEDRKERGQTDIIVVSDHGCSTISSKVDLAASLQKIGIKATREFKSKPGAGEILVVSNSGSTLVYVIGHDEKIVQQVVSFLQGWEATGVIFTRKALPGTFGLDQAHLDSSDAPDVLVSLRWTAEKNKNGTPGMVTADVSSFSPGQGLHVSLSPFDMRATLIAAGPDFRPGVVSDLASGNLDIAPTVLWILGIAPPKPMDGRVLMEGLHVALSPQPPLSRESAKGEGGLGGRGALLTIGGAAAKSSEHRRIEAKHEEQGSLWHQYLEITTVEGVEYIEEGNGSRTK